MPDTPKKGNQKWLPLIQLLQTYKPDFVSCLATGGYHLSGCYITATILLPTLPDILQQQKYKRAAHFALRQIGIYVALQHTRFTQNYCYQQFP